MPRLVLTRKLGQTITMDTANGVITVKFTQCRGKQIRLQIDAPSSVKVVRNEAIKKKRNTLPRIVEQPGEPSVRGKQSLC